MHSILSTYNVHIANSKRQTEYNEKHKEAHTQEKTQLERQRPTAPGKNFGMVFMMQKNSNIEKFHALG